MAKLKTMAWVFMNVVIFILAVAATIYFPWLLIGWGCLIFYLVFGEKIYKAVHGHTYVDGILVKHNELHGTNFSTENPNLSFGAVPGSGFFFDPEKRKICHFKNKDSVHVFDYSYIKSWELNWIEKSKNGMLTFENVHFAFATSDLANPVIRIHVGSKTTGENWLSRLNILFAN